MLSDVERICEFSGRKSLVLGPRENFESGFWDRNLMTKLGMYFFVVVEF
jgi:hypothetical protein